MVSDDIIAGFEAMKIKGGKCADTSLALAQAYQKCEATNAK